ncbi:MAG: N4-gp56 family major capsid protein, partial [Clostridia bacterium]
HPIPKNNGKTIEFRKYLPLPKLTTPLAEGVTPNGQKLSMTTFTAEVKQYGGFTEISDMLDLVAVDNNLVIAMELLGDQAGRTLDTLCREVIASGTNVIYGDESVSARYMLVGGEVSGNHYLTVKALKHAVRKLKVMNARTYDKSYVAIVHPDTTFDITEDADWKTPHQYVDTENIYNHEIGRIANTRFVETTEAKVFHAADLVATGGANDARNLTVKSYAAKVITIEEALSAADAAALAGRKIIVGCYKYTIASATAGAAAAAKITIAEQPSRDPVAADVVYPGEAGAKGRDVYATLVIGKDAYGTTEIEGGGLQHIVKQLGSGGTSDPLNQRATAGWKSTAVTEMLVQEYMVRIETASTFEVGAN